MTRTIIEGTAWVFVGAIVLSAIGVFIWAGVLIAHNYAARRTVVRAINLEPQLLARIITSDTLAAKLETKIDIVLSHAKTAPEAAIDKSQMKTTLVHLLNEGSDRFIARTSRTPSKKPARPNLERRMVVLAIDLLNEIVNDPDYFNSVVSEISTRLINTNKNEAEATGSLSSHIIAWSLRGRTRHTLKSFVNFLVRDVTLELEALHLGHKV